MSRTVHLFASLAAALLLAVVVAAVATLEPAQAAFPGKNGKIAFSSGVIYVMNPNGSGVRPLIGATGHSPTWSADGTRIAFVSDGDIYSMNADGSNRTQLTNNSDQEYNPTWAPNGKKIAYEREVPVGSDQVLSKVYIMNANGSHQVPLQADPLLATRSPAWSPDGSKIALVGIGSFGREQIYTVNVDGTGLTRLTGPSTGDVVTAGDFYTRDSPNWAPNGSKIAFVRFGPCSAQSCLVEDTDYDVLVMNADGRGNKRLTDNLVHDLEPAWSPNGRRIVFERAGDLGGIWRMRPDGSYQTKLTSGGQSPDWQPLP